MANNSNRKAIEFMVQGALPPHSTNVLWMDTSVPTLPVLKIFENGAWTTVHTEQGKVDELLAKTVLEQAKVIEELSRGVDIKIDEIKDDISTINAKIDDVSEDINTLDTQVAKESNATLNKNEIKQEVRNVAGSCIIPDFELPCIPFVPEGFCAIYGDADYIIGDFAPQTIAEQFEIGSIIRVTGDNTTEEEFEGYPEGSLMAVAKTTLEPTGYAEGLYQDVEGYMQGITEEIIWQKGGYYRVTGIIECYSEVIEDNISIFTYEEVDPATITDMGKKIVKKLDEVKEVAAKETTAQEIKELVLQEGIILGNEYAETINNIVGDFSNE